MRPPYPMSREKPTLGKLHLQTSKQSLPHLQFSTVQLHHCSLHGVILLDSFVNMLIRTFDGQIPDKPQNSEKIWPKAEISSQQTNCPAKSQQSGTPVYAIQGHTAIYFPWLKTHNSSRGPVNVASSHDARTSAESLVPFRRIMLEQVLGQQFQP